MSMQIKGPVLTPVSQYIKLKFGDQGYNDWLGSLTDEARQIYDHVILPLNWYPMKISLTEPMIKMCDLFYGGDFNGARELGRYVAEFDMKGFKKYMARIVSPEYLIKQTPKVIMGNWKPTTVENYELSKKHAIVRIIEFPEMHQVIENRFIGFAERSIMIAGGENLKINLSKSFLRGDNCTEFTFDWE